MIKKIMMTCVVLGIIAIICPVNAEKKFSYSLHGVTFETRVEFSSPAEAGTDALAMVYPKDSPPGEEKMSITAVLYTRDTQKLMGMSDPGLLNYTKSVFMGTAASGKTIERAFAGMSVKGEMLEKKIPSPSMIEVFIVTLLKGGKIGFCFKYTKEIRIEEAQKIIAEIGATLKE
ncbi:MAG: hypothetical protein A2176_10225 [Spirochaetes bacterium RBG_13_51_14]|nr:MAG: hypothetical protein A2176_10225 [Spirochaetes bacterium RBG_13_51_14]